MHIVEQEFKKFISIYLENKKTFFIAHSGGVDSQVLLYLSCKYIKDRTTSLNMNHGISINTDQWSLFCKKEAERYGVPFFGDVINLKNEQSNVEEKARELRYSFFKSKINEESCLMTGHHLDDQAETFMLRLMRGAGVDGLSSMQSERNLGKGLLIRPLLNVSKEEIIDFAKSVNLKWVEDESNKDSDYDRNFIRNEIIPLLKTRWVNANKLIARSSSHCKEAKNKIEEITRLNLESVRNNENQINSNKISEFNHEDQKLIIRLWLKDFGCQMPDEKALNVIIKEVIFARPDSKACFKNKKYHIKKSFGKIYFIDLNKKIKFDNIEGFEKNEYNPSIRMLYNGKMKKLKSIMKEEKIPEWERMFYPFYSKGDDVVAVGNIKSDLEFKIDVKKNFV